MNWVDLLIAVIKILIVIGFLLTAAGVSTWAERRQSAMVQDRVGPNRAMIELPSLVVRAIILLPPSTIRSESRWTSSGGMPAGPTMQMNPFSWNALSGTPCSWKVATLGRMRMRLVCGTAIGTPMPDCSTLAAAATLPLPPAMTPAPTSCHISASPR